MVYIYYIYIYIINEMRYIYDKYRKFDIFIQMKEALLKIDIKFIMYNRIFCFYK